MSAEVKALENSPVLWAITIGMIAIVWFLAYFCIVRSKKASVELGMPQDKVSMAIKTSVISAIFWVL